MSLRRLKKKLNESRQKLLAYRNRRIPPLKDDKVLTDWNGLMIAAFARGGQVLGNHEYAEVARRSADFMLKKLRRKDGRLLHRYREGEAIIPAYLDDYAFLIWGLIELYEASFDGRYLQEAVDLTNEMIKLFWDEKEGGFYFSAKDNEKLIARMKEVYDGAIPSGNSVAALDLLLLARLTMNDNFEKKAARLMESFGGKVASLPGAFTQFLVALDFATGSSKEIVIAGDLKDKDTIRMLKALRSRFIPNSVIILHPGGKDGKEIEKIVPFIKNQKMINGKATAYICENYMCKMPTNDISVMISLLGSR